jgi:dihydroorotate dehydrogenase electron transfer subunit
MTAASTPAEGRPEGPLHVRGEVLAAKTAGAFRHLTVVAPGIGERSRPGSFVAVSVGEASLARRALWIHRVRTVGGHRAALDVVVQPRGAGTRWLAALQPGAPLEVTGPLGRPFSPPREPVRCLLVGEGYAAAPLLPLSERLRERGCTVRLVLCGPDEHHLLDVLETRRAVGRVDVVTGDPASVVRAAVGEADVVYAAGATSTLRLCAEESAAAGISCQVALEQPLTCATGLCHGCPVPVFDDDGSTHVVRDCVDGPVFRAGRVDWDRLAGGTG